MVTFVLWIGERIFEMLDQLVVLHPTALADQVVADDLVAECDVSIHCGE